MLLIRKYTIPGLESIAHFIRLVSSRLVRSPVEPVIPIRWEDDKPC